MEKKTLLLILGIIIVIAVFVGTIIYYGRVIEEGYHYTYMGRDKSEYAFDVIRLDGVKGLFHKVTFVIKRDDGKLYKYYTLFRYGPKELEDIPLDQVSKDILYTGNEKKGKIYITQDPNLPMNSSKISSLAVLDITKITKGMGGIVIYGVPTEMVFTEQTPELKDAGIEKITCDDVKNDTAVILIKMGDQNKIYKEDNGCVVLEAKNYEDITKVSDKFIMHLLGIF